MSNSPVARGQSVEAKSYRPPDWASAEWAELLRSVQEAAKACHRAVATPRPYRSPTWVLAWRLSRHPKFVELEQDEAVELLDRAFGELGCSDPESVEWTALLPSRDSRGNEIEPRDDFLACWNSCRKAGIGALAEAYDRASRSPCAVFFPTA